jgi:hypothetical protein
MNRTFISWKEAVEGGWGRRTCKYVYENGAYERRLSGIRHKAAQRSRNDVRKPVMKLF